MLLMTWQSAPISSRPSTPGRCAFMYAGRKGTRIEETEQLFGRVEDAIRAELPAGALTEVIDNIGLPNGGFNLAFGDSATIGSSDGEILLSLNPESHLAVVDVQRRLRRALHERFPDDGFFFQAANITNQILNFGIPAPIDVQITGRDQGAAYKVAQDFESRLEVIPGAVDVHIRQEVNTPAIDFNVDRDKAARRG
jgi:multidrug efflux pump subunit AcrB